MKPTSGIDNDRLSIILNMISILHLRRALVMILTKKCHLKLLPPVSIDVFIATNMVKNAICPILAMKGLFKMF